MFDIQNKTPENVTQTKELSEYCQTGCVFESEHCVDRPCRHLEATWAGNMAEADAISEEFTFFQINYHTCVVQ